MAEFTDAKIWLMYIYIYIWFKFYLGYISFHGLDGECFKHDYAIISFHLTRVRHANWVAIGGTTAFAPHNHVYVTVAIWVIGPLFPLTSTHPNHQGPVSIYRPSYLRMVISMLKIRRPLGRLIFNMGIAIPGKTVFLIETAPRWWKQCLHKNPINYHQGNTPWYPPPAKKHIWRTKIGLMWRVGFSRYISISYRMYA